MKNQYAGDVNDFRKYGLLRALRHESDLSLLVCWMLTPDDGSADGNRVSYLSKPARWRVHDPALFDALQDVFTHPDGRGVRNVELAGVLSPARFQSEMIPDDRRGRAQYFERTLALAKDSHLAFFDPDNGLEVPSKPKGGRGSSRYLYWDELAATYEGGASILAYQHFPREKREPYTRRRMRQLRSATGANWLGGDGDGAAGVCHARGRNVGLPPIWLIYLPVGDLAESLRRVLEEGGTVIKHASGTQGEHAHAVVQDPVGACLALVPG